MKKTLKLFSILLSLAFILVVLGCENGSTPETTTPPASEGTTQGGTENGSTPGTTSLNAPANLKATESKEDHDKLSLSWDNVEGAKYYYVYQNTSDDFSTAKKIATIQDTSRDVTLNSAGTYYFWVEATGSDSTGNTIKSPTSTITYTFSSQELAVPKYVTAVQSTTTVNAITVSWQNNGADKYYIYYNTRNDATSAMSIQTSYGSDDYAYSSDHTKECFPKSTGTYYFWVVAADSNGNKSGYSQAVSCEFIQSIVPEPTGILAAQNTGKNSARVSWNANNASSYVVYYNTTNNSDTATKASVSASTDYSTGLKYADIPLSSSGTYYFWVKALDGNKVESVFSQAAHTSFTVQGVPAPTNVTVKKSATDASAVTVSWTESENAYYYDIYYNTTNSTSGATKGASNVYVYLEASKDIRISSPSGTYYFWVKAKDKAGVESNYSNPVAIITF